MVARTRPLIIRARVVCARSRHGKRREWDAGAGRGEAGREGVSLIWYEGGCSGSRFFDSVDGPGKTKRTVKDRRRLAMAGEKRKGSPGGNGQRQNRSDWRRGKGRGEEKGKKERAREGEKRREEKRREKRRKKKEKRIENRRRETEKTERQETEKTIPHRKPVRSFPPTG